MMSTQSVPARLSRWVRVTFFILVHVQVRVGHVGCECVIRLLETQAVPARSRAWREHIMHCFVTLKFSCDESCSDSVLSMVQIPACRHSLLPESNVQVHGLVHSKFCEWSSSFSLAFVASSVSASSTRGSSNSPASSWPSKYSAVSSSSVPDIATPATVKF